MKRIITLNKKIRTSIIIACAAYASSYSQSANVDVNLNIKHEVGGVSDFGRERHITLHAALTEPDWTGEEAKMKYLLEDLDVYLGRDNGRATFLFQDTPVDPEIANYPNIDSMDIKGKYWKKIHEEIEPFRLQYESRSTEMIMGTNPHPTYPTLSWFDNGSTTTNPPWQPKTVETSADWVTEYLDRYFAKSQGEDGMQLPKYWEVINEPDMLMMTGQFMVTSQEKLWEYHNLVAEGVKARLGEKAPLIGGMTWGQHDFYRPDGIGRFKAGYLDEFLDTENKAIHSAMSQTAYGNIQKPWYQWDVMWKGFMDVAGDNMDFYAVHIYDWPLWESEGGAIRSGGHTEAMLDMMEWYDVNKNGVRKPVVISEYGAVSTYIDKPNLDPKRRDWENLKPFSNMLMQFLERPDYITKTMPFTPVKAEWGDYRNGDGEVTNRYPYTMMDQDAAGNWQWSEYIKWYELWADVEGTRIDTKANDLDVQVDAYIDGKTTYLILNNLETSDKVLNLNFFGENGNTIENVRIKHLFLSGNQPTLTDTVVDSAPKSVTIGAESTMILAYNYAQEVQIDEISKEYKYYGESLSGSNGSTPHRVQINNGTLTAQVNGVNIPSKGEAMLRLCGSYFWTHISSQDDRNIITVNGFPLEFNSDWRGEDPGRNTFFGVLEVPVPIEYLKTNNVITSTLLNQNTYTNVSIQVWDMSVDPGRSDGTTPVETVSVTGVNVSPTSGAVDKGATTSLTASTVPANATNQFMTWTSSQPEIATVDANGLVTGVNLGTTTITIKTTDGNFEATAQITVNPAALIDVTGISVSPTSRTIFVGQSIQSVATILPEDSSNKKVNWLSNNSAIASVDSSGLITAISTGVAIITATTDDGEFKATTTITVTAAGNSLIIQAEDYTSTGGAFDGFQTFVANGITGTNFNQTGDWAEYSINIAEGGDYQVDYFLGTSVNGAAIEFILDNTSVMKDNVPNNESWDTFESLTASQPVTLSSGNHVIRLLSAGTSGWEWNMDRFELTKLGVSSEINVDGISVSTTLVSLNEGETEQLSASVSPQNATDKTVNWSSNNSSVASVDSNGLVTGVTGGTAIITATAVNGGFSANSTVIVSESVPSSPLVIQAEDFSNTGGTSEGFQIYNTGGITATNFNQTGDWAEYTINVSENGTYEVEYFMGTSVNGAAVEFILDGVSVMKDNVANNGNWDTFVSLKSSQSFFLSSGTHTIRLLSVGTNGWEWNMDRFILTKARSLKRLSNSNSVSIYPNPAIDFITIGRLGQGESHVKIYDIKGINNLSRNINSADNTIQIDRLAIGVYFIEVVNKTTGIKNTFRLIKN